jgi:aerobic carbon-monoxide dehydrogenase small subunit
MKHPITVRVNGESYREEVEARTLLVQFLRDRLGLTGTHVGCVVGECGACSVLVDGALVKSCLMLAVQVNEREVTTIEGLAQQGTLSPVQEAFVKNFALQCGFCTPGFVMASHALLARNPQPSEEQIRKDLSSNLCMCTGYVQIVEAVKEAAATMRANQARSDLSNT